MQYFKHKQTMISGMNTWTDMTQSKIVNNQSVQSVPIFNKGIQLTLKLAILVKEH